MEIQKINVKETLKIVLEDQKDIESVLIAQEQELRGERIDYPPEDNWDLLIYVAERGLMFTYRMWNHKTPEKLMSFVKLPKELQQRILYRAFYVYRKFYTVNTGGRSFPLRFE